MKWVSKLPVLGAALLLPASASAAITLDGTVPVRATPTVLIQANHQTGTTGVVKFKFSAPQAGAYTVGFCIGPETNPCGSAGALVVSVKGGESKLSIVNASAFEKNVLAVEQGTSTPVPFAVSVE
jgi:hypothetical protein